MKKTEDNLIAVKSKAFAIRIVKLYKYLCDKNMLEDCVEIIRLLMSITKTAEGK